ncbi:hypothetical protein FW774_05145 (plasmid) [Pedobacter sp. BS3]|uniref:hypothetical protein n=1 Tax=Pedobacter sp. BS3 TaxID=2567937 RepID=UPI0011EE5305|nr:hypothetical protein [Pedobacter sp. BS3]TZF86431.1 hypothetical protein FW774_05145 [Pedobacter sp. BS3]
MSKTNTLTLLINSLSKGEKRYFKLYTSLQQGSKDYLYLFELFEKGSDSIADIREAFLQKRPKASYEATSKYLYKIITDCMLHLRTEKDITTKLVTALLKANIMFEKSLYEEGFKQLQKIQATAEEFELYIIELWAARLELYYLCNLNFHTITEPELIQKQMNIADLLKYARNAHQHTSLYELLRHRLLYKGSVRTPQQKEELNDLVVSELNIVSNPTAETFESHKTHLLFQAHYFITVSDYKSALKTFYELNDLFEEHNYLWVDSPMDYLSTIEGILDSLHTIKRYDEMHFFLQKLQFLENQSVYFEIMVQRLAFIYTIVGYLDRGDFDEAEALKKQFEQTLFKKIHLLDISKQAEVYLYTALIYIGGNNMPKAHYYLNRILLESKLYYALPVYRTFRLIHLLVHFEMENHDYIEYETRSIKRSLSSSHKRDYLLEKIVFKFIQQPVQASGNKGRQAIWQKFKQQFDAISSDKYEIQLLKIFDFASWIEAKLCRKPFAILLKEKYQKTVETYAGN